MEKSDGDEGMTIQDWQRLARQENRRMREVWNSGLADAYGAERTLLFEIPGDRHALAARLKPLFEAGLPADEIATHERLPEPAVWQALAIHLRARHGMAKFALPPVFYRMRLKRISALRATGMKRCEVAAQLGISEWVIDSDHKRVREMEGQADAGSGATETPGARKDQRHGPE